MDKTILQSKSLLVVGDMMLDKYWFGDATRISPEAPVPVVRVQRTEERLGGAANVALNVRSLGSAVTLMSFVGRDEAGETAVKLLEQAGITPRLHIDPQLKTTVKLRLLARQQQVVRIDFEDHPGTEVLSALTGEFAGRIGNFDALILSDYGKGGLDHIVQMIASAREAGIPILIDPKGSNSDRYNGGHDHHAEPLGARAGRGPVVERSGACREGAEPEGPPGVEGAPPHPQRRRHDAI